MIEIHLVLLEILEKSYFYIDFFNQKNKDICLCKYIYIFFHSFLLLYSCFGILSGDTILEDNLSDLIFLDLNHNLINETTNLNILVLQFCESIYQSLIPYKESQKIIIHYKALIIFVKPYKMSIIFVILYKLLIIFCDTL